MPSQRPIRNTANAAGIVLKDLHDWVTMEEAAEIIGGITRAGVTYLLFDSQVFDFDADVRKLGRRGVVVIRRTAVLTEKARRDRQGTNRQGSPAPERRETAMSIDLVGIPQGMGIYHVSASLDTAAKGGWAGNRQLPRMWFVGGTAGDAIKNARTVLDPLIGTKTPDGGQITGIRLHAVNADWDDTRFDTATYNTEDNPTG